MLARALPISSIVSSSALTGAPLASPVSVPNDRTGQRAGAAGTASASAVALPGGSTARANVDAPTAGGGGEATGAYEVVLLVSERAPVTLVDAPLNAADRSQAQRIDTARDRASWENRRATPHPADDAFLASGAGLHRERRELSSVDPRQGARTAPSESREGDPSSGEATSDGQGTATGSRADRAAVVTPGREAPAAGGSRGGARGTERASPGRGILEATGRRESARAAVATGRPSLDHGPAATTALQAGRVRDDVDAELLAASLFESRVDASRRAGLREGSGRGGTVGPAGEGTGTGGVGGSAQPFGPGSGGYDALDTSDGRYRSWLLSQRRRIEARLVFPRARQLARDQGTSVVRLTVRRDGSVATPPRVIRSSGFEDLDAAALLAVRESLPFAAIPDDLARGHAQVPVTLPIEFSNPMVR